MPRDGSGIYTKPFPDVVTGTTIQSTVHNGTISDVAQDLNAPRPIVAGGTGANNARDAMTSLQGDVAYQVVTNYDAYAFVSGSFYSAAGATSAPTANAFIGQCYTSDPAVVPPAVPAGQNMFIEARDVTTGSKYLRQKTAGVWGTWKSQGGIDLDAAYVNVSGDTMAGPLNLVGGSHWSFASPGSGSWYASNAAADRFFLGSDATGDTFRLYAAGAAKNAFTVDGATANLTAGNNLSAVGTITSILTATTGTYYFGNSGTKLLAYDGTNFSLVGGPLMVNTNGITSGNGGALGTYFFGNTGTKYLNYDGTNFAFTGGALNTRAAGFLNHTSNNAIQFNWGGGGAGLNYIIDGATNFKLWDTANSVAAGAANGYQKFASGIILQWGFVAAATENLATNYPITYPNACLHVSTLPVGNIATTSLLSFSIPGAPNTVGFLVQPRYVNTGGAVGQASQGFFWYAVGY
jgi:hypothetical protein